MILNLNFNHLYYFYLIGRSGGLTQAANLLHISQPSLSAQMKVLEARLGIRLFRKQGRKLVLTTEGHRVLSSCERMFSVAETLERDLKSEADDHQLRVHLGVSSDIERPFAVDVLSRAISKKHRVKIRFLSGSEEQLQRELNLGNFDFVLTTQPLFSDKARVLAELDLPVVAGIAKKLLKPNDKPRRLHDLPNRLIAPSPTQKLRKEMDLFLEKKKVSPQVVFESDVMGALIRAISDGIGWGLFPKPYLRHESLAKNIVLLGPPEGFWRHRIYFLGSVTSPKHAEFQDAVLKALSEELDL